MMVLIAAKKRKLLARIAELEEYDELNRQVIWNLLRADKDRQQEYAENLTELTGRTIQLNELTDKLNDIEAYVGPLHSSANSVYRKVARDLTAIIQAPPEPDDDDAVAMRKAIGDWAMSGRNDGTAA